MFLKLYLDTKSKFVAFLHLRFTDHQDYFTPFKSSQSLGGSKTGDSPEKNTKTHTHTHTHCQLQVEFARAHSGGKTTTKFESEYDKTIKMTCAPGHPPTKSDQSLRCALYE